MFEWSMHGVMNLIAGLLILSGTFFAVSAAVGLVRFRDVITRMHSSAKPQSMGLILTITGVFLHLAANDTGNVAVRGDLGMLLLILLFALVTAPVVSNRVGNVVYREGLIDRDALSRDDECRAQRDAGAPSGSGPRDERDGRTTGGGAAAGGAAGGGAAGATSGGESV